ncbi:MAG: chemotaxis protein CheX [Verrucomicrobiota bacterium]
MEERDLKIFVDGTRKYFDLTVEEPVEVGTPYLLDEESIILDFIGVIGISGKHRGCVYYTCSVPMAQRLAQEIGETEASEEILGDLVGEIANIIAGNSREFLGPDFMISVPAVIRGGESVQFPRDLPRFVIPIVWSGFTAYLLLCLDLTEGSRAS